MKKYGNIFSLNLGDLSSVIITGLPLIKKVFTHMEQDILNRPVALIREHISKNNGKFIEQQSVYYSVHDVLNVSVSNFPKLQKTSSIMNRHV